MRSTSFKNARKRVSRSVLQIGTSVLVLGLALSASARDASPSGETVVVTKADGKTGIKSLNWLQVGLASWYGLQFQGRKTAGGERFNMNEMTCAHPTLPMGTWLRVTNLKNKKSTYVRVNDRGPMLENRIVDLSFAAARTLGLAGVGKVKLEAVRQSDPDLARALVAQLQVPAVFQQIGLQ